MGATRHHGGLDARQTKIDALALLATRGFEDGAPGTRVGPASPPARATKKAATRKSTARKAGAKKSKATSKKGHS